MKYRGENKKREAMFIIVNLILSMFAFSFLIGVNLNVVNAADSTPIPAAGKTPMVASTVNSNPVAFNIAKPFTATGADGAVVNVPSGSVQSVAGGGGTAVVNGQTVTFTAEQIAQLKSSGNLVQTTATQTGAQAAWGGVGKAVGTIFNSLLWGALMAGVGYMLGEMLGPENSNAGKAAAIAMGVGGTRK